MTYELTDSFIVRSALPQTWSFFSTRENLPRITPPWLRFRNVRGPDRIQLNSQLDYTIRWSGLPVKWRTLIIEWNEPHSFTDLQLRGPYAMWHHRHTFTPAPEGTRCEDRVLYRLPFGPLGRLTHAALVRRQLLDIFRYRRTVIAADLGLVRPLQPDVTIQPADIPRSPGREHSNPYAAPSGSHRPSN